MGKAVVHFEIAGTDRHALQQFYGDVFDWHVQDMPEMEYGMVKPSERGIGGGLWQDATPSVRIYVEVDDLDATLKQIEANGGAIETAPMEVPDIVTFALFRDPAGNTIGLVQGDGTGPTA